jgi:hypothetical protein
MMKDALEQLPQKEVICAGCRLKFGDVVSYKLHRATEFHIYNTKRAVAELPPISEELFEQKKNSKSILQVLNFLDFVLTFWWVHSLSLMVDSHLKG